MTPTRRKMKYLDEPPATSVSQVSRRERFGSGISKRGEGSPLGR